MQVKFSFPLIEIIDLNSKTIILARGHEIPVNTNPKLSTILSSLNEGKKLSLEELQDKLSPEWDLVDIFSTLDQLYKISAIEITT